MKEFTSVIAALVAFAVTAGMGFFVIPYLRKLKFGQTILDIGPNWHKEKQGTPTMGGIMIIGGVLIGLAMAFTYSACFGGDFALELKDAHRLTNLVSGVVMALCMSAIGFIDDYVKVVKKRNLGLTAKQKTFLQLLVAALYLISLYMGGMTTTNIPFIGEGFANFDDFLEQTNLSETLKNFISGSSLSILGGFTCAEEVPLATLNSL